MKRLLLILALPCALMASEEKPECSMGKKVAKGATVTGFLGASSYTGYELCINLGKAITTGDWVGGALAVGKAGVQIVSIATYTANTMEIIDPADKRTPLQKAADDSALHRRIVEEKAATDFELCLNEHAHCRDLTSHGIPKRCASPARRYGMINELATKELIARFRRYNTHNN